MKALANNTISVARNSKAKSKSFRTKSRKKNYLVRNFFLHFNSILLHQRVYYLHNGENYVLSSESESESLALDESIHACFCRVGLFVLFSLRQMRKTEQDK